MRLLSKAREFRFRIKTLLGGVRTYKKTGVTPYNAYACMRHLYCQTRGRSNRLLSALVSAKGRPGPITSVKGVLGELNAQDVEQITTSLRQNGYHHFEQKLPEEMCERLLRFAVSSRCNLMPTRDGMPARLLYDRSNPVTVSYHFDEQELFNNPDIQDLASDLSLGVVAQAYLECPPLVDLVGMWWSTAFAQTASSEVAQLFHFDMDRLKFLKFFFYLTDVTPKNGPHVYVRTSHRRDGKPAELWRDGRVPDADIEKHYSPGDIVEVCAPRGSIFVGDTSAFHKGTVVQSDDRLVLEIEFCNSLFGAPYKQIHLGPTTNRRLVEQVETYPASHRKFIIDN